MTEQQLIKWAPASEKVASVVTKWFNSYADHYEVNTSLRIAAFISQLIHESGSFRYLTELASGKAYEGNNKLGNIYPGDGVRYKGRGYIQITGRNNYLALSRYIFNDNRLLNNPELVATPQYGMLASFWFWDKEGLNELADKQLIQAITQRINGGLNGLEDRLHYYNIISTDLNFSPN